MALFGRGKKQKKQDAEATKPTAPAAAGDVFSPFWTNWPPTEPVAHEQVQHEHVGDPPPEPEPPTLRRRVDERELEPRDRVLIKALPDDWLPDMALDPTIAFVLSLVDGVSTIDDVLDGCGLVRPDAVAILVELLHESVLEARPPPPRTGRPPR